MTTLVHLPLGSRPRLVNCGMAEHGLRGREEYLLPRLWCLHLYFYEVRLEAQGRPCQIVPGSLTLIPPRTRLVYHYGHRRCRHFFVHFAAEDVEPVVATTLFQHVPDGRDEILDRLQNMQRVLGRNSLHAETLFWGLLWDIAESGRREPQEDSPGEALFRIIENFTDNRLSEELSVREIARAAGVTSTHVNRVVKKFAGRTTVQFIRLRRLQRAYRLLLHSTMPVKLIAAECGIGDLQQFNKLVRAEYGKSPRQLRRQLWRDGAPTWALDRG